MGLFKNPWAGGGTLFPDHVSDGVNRWFNKSGTDNVLQETVDLKSFAKFNTIIRAFIPWDRVTLDDLNLALEIATLSTTNNLSVHGDGKREPTFNLSSLGYGADGKEGYRVQFLFEIDMAAELGSQANTNGYEWNAGTTIVYNNDVAIYIGKAKSKDLELSFDFKEVIDGKSMSSNMRKDILKNAQVDFTVSAHVPAPQLANLPSIDFDGTFEFVVWDNGEQGVFIDLDHDGFPALEIFVQDVETKSVTTLFTFMPTKPSDGRNLAPFLGDASSGRIYKMLVAPPSKDEN